MGQRESANLHVVGGDTEFVRLYENHFRHVHAYCRRRVDLDRVDDAVADVFLVAWKKIDEIPDNPLPWLYGVAFRVVGQQWRGKSRKRKLERKLSAVGIEPAAAADEYTVKRSEVRMVIEALEALKPNDQEVLRLSLWEELDHTEAALVLGLSEATYRQRLSRARKSLTLEFNRLESGRTNPPTAQKGGTP